MKSRERVLQAINHKQPDVVPVDFGATSATGINVSTLYHLLPHLGLRHRSPVISDTMQLLSLLDEDVTIALGTDVVPLLGPKTKIGTTSKCNLAPFTMPDGTPALIPETVKYHVDKDGVYYQYPQGDVTAEYSMVMPAGGSFFDAIERSTPFDEDALDPETDFADFFTLWNDETAMHYEKASIHLFHETDYAIACQFGQGGFGDLAKLPGPTVKSPKGIRHVEDFITAHILYPDYIHEIFEKQCETALKNLEILKQSVGERIQIICVGGTDFGTQNGLYYSKEIFRSFYAPYIKRINNYIHKNTSWKTFFHSCGAISELLDDFIDIGTDIINPVQCSASGMDPEKLKSTYGDRIVFWGGGVDSQSVLSFGTPEEVSKQVKERISIFNKNGGYVFASVHNIVADTPSENIVAMIKTLAEARGELR